MGIKARRRARRVAREFSGSGSWNPSDPHGEDVARFFESVLRRDARAFGGDDGTHRARATPRERRRRKGGSMDWLLHILATILVSFADVLGGVFARVTPTRAQYASRRVLRDDAPEDDIFRRGFRAGPRGNRERADERPTPPAPPTSRSADPFRALGLEREGATPDDVARAYRALAFRWHPDKNGQSDESHAAMQTINAARAACLFILRGAERYDSDDPDDTGSNPAGDEDEDDDKVGAARRAQTRVEEAYTRALGRERARVRTERTHPGRRFRRQTAVHDAKTNANRGRGSVNRDRDSSAGDSDCDAHRDSTGCSGSARRRPTLDCYLDRMDTETSEVARAARASAGLVLLQLLLYRFPPLLEVDADGNTPLHYAARYDPGLVDTVMTALGDEWARAATLANRHGHIPKDMLTPAVEHLDAATALAADWDRGTDWDRSGPKRATNRDERDERVANAATRAEASRNGAARLRSLTRTARRREASREAETMRTFDARRFARLGMAAAAATAAVAAARGGWTVAAAAGVAAMWLGLVGETRRGETRGYGRRSERDGMVR